MNYPACLPRRQLSLRKIVRLAAFVGATFTISTALFAADAKTRRFDIPASDADVALRTFSKQAEVELVFSVDKVAGVKTNATRGDFTALNALKRMLIGTELVAVQDESTGALSVGRRPLPPQEKGPVKPNDDPPSIAPPPPAALPTPEEVSRASVSPRKPADEVVEMNPYEVKADADTSYGALNSNSITSFNTALEKIPISADIFTQAFMTDVGATTVEGLLTGYSAGTGYAGQDPSNAAQANQPGDRAVNAFMQLRGFNTPAMQRDGFMAVGSFGSPGSTAPGVTSNFDTERVEVINGPQALLYGGGGGAGGVVNVVSKQARIGQPAFGSLQYRIDEFGSKLGQLDYGWSTDKMAVRLALMNQVQNNRRVNVGGWITGTYLQLAFQPFRNTTIRLNGEQTKFNRLVAGMAFLTAPTNDPRNKASLRVILAMFTQGANDPVTGATYPSGAIDNGKLNWGNVDSYQGAAARELSINTLSMLTAETQWTKTISTRLAVGYNDYRGDRVNLSYNFYAPGAAGNLLPGWAGGATPADSIQPNRTKVLRFSTLFTHDLFQGKAHSQTIVGADYSRSDSANIAYGYYQADSNFNIIPIAGTANAGRIPIGKIEWSLDNGPVLYNGIPFPGTKKITVDGVNYVRQLANPVDRSLISPTNPLGTLLTSGNYQINKFINKGIYFVNYTQLMENRLDVLAGARFANYFNDQFTQNAPFERLSTSNAAGFNLGVDYAVKSWLHPYITVSDSFTPPLAANQTDPFNLPPQTTHGFGQEVGLKVNNASGSVSGSIAVYHASAKNDLYPLPPTISGYANPAGLNGGGGGSFINVDRTSRGVQLALTAATTKNWRMRLSGAWVDGTIGTSVSYDEVYNDQFYANSQGQVTYKDGTVVFVNPSVTGTATASRLIATPTTPGAVPLTITAMSTPSNFYFANPGGSGAINRGSNAGTVLLFVDPVHGPILTGATYLPISNYQLIPSLTGVTPPGNNVVASRAGDQTTGYPAFSVNYTTSYTFSSGWIKGFRVGGTAAGAWQFRNYFYYPNGTGYTSQGAPVRVPVYKPTVVEFGLITGYSRKFQRFTWHTQVNVSNIFNHYQIIILPNQQTAYTSLGNLNATLTTQPRSFVWTNTIDF